MNLKFDFTVFNDEKNIQLALIEVIVQFIGYIFIDVLFEGVFKACKKANDFILELRFGKQSQSSTLKKTDQLKALKKELLYKKIELTALQFNPYIKRGCKGAVLEVINSNKVFAEFYDSNNKQIEFENELVFEIEMSQFKLL